MLKFPSLSWRTRFFKRKFWDSSFVSLRNCNSFQNYYVDKLFVYWKKHSLSQPFVIARDDMTLDRVNTCVISCCWLWISKNSLIMPPLCQTEVHVCTCANWNTFHRFQMLHCEAIFHVAFCTPHKWIRVDFGCSRIHYSIKKDRKKKMLCILLKLDMSGLCRFYYFFFAASIPV